MLDDVAHDFVVHAPDAGTSPSVCDNPSVATVDEADAERGLRTVPRGRPSSRQSTVTSTGSSSTASARCSTPTPWMSCRQPPDPLSVVRTPWPKQPRSAAITPPVVYEVHVRGFGRTFAG